MIRTARPLLLIRKARPLESYPPIVFVPEPAIRDVVRVALCACGTTLTQHADETVPEVVEAHNATAAHRKWRMVKR